MFGQNRRQLWNTVVVTSTRPLGRLLLLLVEVESMRHNRLIIALHVPNDSLEHIAEPYQILLSS